MNNDLIKILGNIRDELQVLSVPEDLRKNQRKLMFLENKENTLDAELTRIDIRLDDLFDQFLGPDHEAIKQKLNTEEFEECYKIFQSSETATRLNKHKTDIEKQLDKINAVIESLIVQGCHSTQGWRQSDDYYNF